jgi:fructose-1,6-bisphosphatase/inositol monophosphatase family enzyme
MKILHILSDNINKKVSIVLEKRDQYSNKQLKTLLDNQAQEAIIQTLKKNKISAQLISEEGNKTIGNGDYIITADPVDGTTNLSRGLQPSVLSVSIATSPKQSEVVAGIVSNFYTGETFYAEKNKGATLDGSEIKPSRYIPYNQGLIGMDLSKYPKLEKTRKLIKESRHLRQEGSTASSLCNVAAGILDAHIDLRGKARATDISAGLFIIKEAGGFYKVNEEKFGDFSLTRETKCTLLSANTLRLLEEIDLLIEKQ